MHRWTLKSRARPSRSTIAMVALTCITTVGCGASHYATWKVEHSRESAFQESTARVELRLRDSWVGEWEDRYGTQLMGSSYDLQLARLCSGEWSVTYPKDTKGLPPPGTELRLWVQTDKGQLDTSDDDSVGVAGSMASNGVTAVFKATPELDGALFIEGFAWIVVAMSDDIQVSASDVRIDSRDPKWIRWLSASPQLPDELGDVCHWPEVDTAPEDQYEQPRPQLRPLGRRPR